MNRQDNRERMNEAVEVEDLTIEESAQHEVKGGSSASGNNLKQIGLGIHNLADTYNR